MQTVLEREKRNRALIAEGASAVANVAKHCAAVDEQALGLQAKNNVLTMQSFVL